MFPDRLTGRIYGGQKYAHFTIPTNGSTPDIIYKANHKFDLGIGATWHNFTLNVGYGLSSLNNNRADKGKTKGFDFQFHLYPHKWAVDVMLVMPKGMYIDPKGLVAPAGKTYYFRKDVQEKLLGIAAYHVPNKEKFSYRAAIQQNEWQKKSAGSVLYGGEIYYGSLKGDSSLIPANIQGNYSQAGMFEVSYITVGPGIGYAFTAVADQHFYLMLSGIANAKVNFVTEDYGVGTKKKTSFDPTIIFKGGIGYNSNNWSVGAYAMGNVLWLKGKSSNDNYFVDGGVFRVQVAKKFHLKTKS
jgi:hypothetical protein